MQESTTQIYILIILATLIFLLVPGFLLIYIRQYNARKAKHLQEKKLMAQQFESELLKTQIEVQEQTMQTIASNLHDNIGQLLSLTNLTLASINMDDREKARKKIDASTDLVNKSIKELRELAKLLQGEKLLERGIAHAIAQEVDWLKKVEVYHISFTDELGENIGASAEKDLIILRLFQEVINNIVKHAQATQIVISLAHKEEKLVIIINENGVGFNYQEVAKNSNGLGLHTIEKRVKLIGGEFNLNTEIGSGTEIILTIPYP
ncbi:sensor histidine kinase [Pedobacter nanyangensis]|uniref:sensor histidine kinase n=1 Tax=Pedobacter nanyangensis TaxID=1562389 RepID=UPI000DE4E678|nr:ATP-binding protein [Pedobacter nanyangensis]